MFRSMQNFTASLSSGRVSRRSSNLSNNLSLEDLNTGSSNTNSGTAGVNLTALPSEYFSNVYCEYRVGSRFLRKFPNDKEASQL